MPDSRDQVQWFIEWTYSPTDFFEQPRLIRHKHCDLAIEEGKVKAKIDLTFGDPRLTLRSELDTYLNNLFIGAQLESHKQFELLPSSVCRERPGGGRDIFVEVSELVMVADIHADLEVTDKDGRVIADSRAERIKRTESLADLAAKHGGTDETARKILQSYHNASKDQSNLFVHLYEIRDALKTRFAGEAEARRALKIPKANWSALGRLSNTEPLKQGRHRGEKSELRNAKTEEVDEGMAAARMMIENYLKYLDGTL
ncbi:MAG: hypothetical protein KBE65_18800 [Phycisphaerae bacterium]|nr:hypothetical protein [Phycisphaerae bacterium]